MITITWKPHVWAGFILLLSPFLVSAPIWVGLFLLPFACPQEHPGAIFPGLYANKHAKYLIATGGLFSIYILVNRLHNILQWFNIRNGQLICNQSGLVESKVFIDLRSRLYSILVTAVQTGAVKRLKLIQLITGKLWIKQDLSHLILCMTNTYFLHSFLRESMYTLIQTMQENLKPWLVHAWHRERKIKNHSCSVHKSPCAY